MALSVTCDLSVRACGRVAKNSARGLRPRALYLAMSWQASRDKFDVSQKSNALLVLLYAFRILVGFGLPNVYFVRHDNYSLSREYH